MRWKYVGQFGFGYLIPGTEGNKKSWPVVSGQCIVTIMEDALKILNQGFWRHNAKRSSVSLKTSR